jgi:hypothetical protein
MFSIYTSLYNLDNDFIDWKGAINNFTDFSDEVCISTLEKDRNILNNFFHNELNKGNKCIIKVYHWSDDILKEPDFDGKMKNKALNLCEKPFCILLDGDERIDVKDKTNWINWANYLSYTPSCDALMIPVFDLYNSEKEYKTVGVKWYLHKNLPHLHRGTVSFAKKEDGKVDINKSDTCELLSFDDKLCDACYITNNLTPSYIKEKCIPKVWHLGWLDKDKRLKANAFWRPVWENRAGHKVDNIIESKEKLDKIEYFSHGLKLWYE